VTPSYALPTMTGEPKRDSTIDEGMPAVYHYRYGVRERCTIEEFLADCDRFAVQSNMASAYLGEAARLLRYLTAQAAPLQEPKKVLS